MSFFLASPANAGWTAYTPLSTDTFTAGPGNSFYIFGIQLSGIGTMLTAINMLITIIRFRAPGMKWFRMPLFAWSTLITSVLIVIAFSALSVALYLLMFDRLFDTSFFGGDQGESRLLAAFILDIWSSRSICTGYTSLRDLFRCHLKLFQENYFRLFVYGSIHYFNRLFRLYGMGTSYVHRWIRPPSSIPSLLFRR
ncbi:cytochrome c oxidase polypeptide I [Gracilibacillus boraciitolerans JCM 21714]|uniref:Cytochrome c oxidase polypeptide I n=1 Tax=Gracilibacillus boraciitolerans JCM 21714 TaxID=1298598 RepID=W4VM47_9BACI|nr:cbb3-type cytochrome c oxidase subunit I [Gracilibacillus boraciitolerans]GAE94251.1 cytochrome c oxidase polypeptide I [Gracilibacillus boraciitolerans JCM 21714]